MSGGGGAGGTDTPTHTHTHPYTRKRAEEGDLHERVGFFGGGVRFVELRYEGCEGEGGGVGSTGKKDAGGSGMWVGGGEVDS